MRNHDLDQEQANVSNLCCPSVSLPNQPPRSFYTLRKADHAAAAAASKFLPQFLVVSLQETLEILMHNVWSVWVFFPALAS